MLGIVTPGAEFQERSKIFLRIFLPKETKLPGILGEDQKKKIKGLALGLLPPKWGDRHGLELEVTCACFKVYFLNRLPGFRF